MATWLDGPEYAPGERPAAFVVPPVAPLAVAEPSAPPVEPPDGEPSFTAPSDAQPELAALVPAGAPGRNPKTPFDVSSAALTAGTWAAPTGQAVRPPTEPFTAPGPSLTGYLPVQPAVQPHAQVNPAPFPAPNTPQWFAPPPDSRVPAAPPPVTIAQIWQAVTAGVLVPLLIGMFFTWLSILMLAVSFALSARIPYRRDAVRRSYMVAMAVLGMVGVVSILANGFDADLLFEALSGGAQVACIILPFVVGLIVASALRAGERPDRFA
ncbi:MAG: hypothetical protein QM779_09685 [Propionicimonas sp.]|uniref:hypothetical protein n=1 Tax=Propionicimonas sp. TaxID=1955623 RepID=UPI003D0BABF4